MLIPAIASAAGGFISGITGLSQKHKGNKLLNSLQYPTEQMPQAVQGLENQGLPSEQYQKAMRDIQRQQQAALTQAQDRRGGLASIGNIQQASNDATLNLNAKDAEMNLGNRRYIAGIQRDLFDKNVRDKYNQQYQYGQMLVGAGNQNFTGGLDKLVGAGAMYGNTMNNKSQGFAYSPYQ